MSKPIRALFYGDAGAGKTAMVVSAFWDYKARKKLREGRLLVIGQEGYDSLNIPEEMVKTFVSPRAKPLQFMEDFTTYVKALVEQAYKGKTLDVIALDSWSEWNHLFLHEFEESGQGSDKWDGFSQAKDKFFSAVQMLSPNVLGAHILATARVEEKKKGVLSKRAGGETIGGDPEYWQDFKYIPAMVGWPRKNLAHYYDIVSWVEVESGPVKLPSGKIRRAHHHNYYFMQEGDYLVKNRWEHDWLAQDLPSYLTNASFDDILNLVERARLGSAPGNTEEKKEVKVGR